MAQSNAPYQMPPWMRPLAQRLSPTIRALVLAVAVPWIVYILVKPLRGPMDDYLVLNESFMRGQIWQIATSIFVDRNPLAFLNILGLWFVGAAIERTLGRRRFLLVFFVPGLAANLVFALSSALWGVWIPNSGCGDAVLGLFVGLAVLYGPAQVRVWGSLAMPARTLAAIFVIFALVVGVANRIWPALFGTMTAVATAYVLCGGRGHGAGDLASWLQRKMARSRMRIMDGGKAKKPRDFLN
jgi:membrane associated rhomboid family serine protease